MLISIHLFVSGAAGKAHLMSGLGLSSQMDLLYLPVYLSWRRSGWASVQISPDGSPVRAVHGGSQGIQQTTGAAERHSVLQALRYYPGAQSVITDLSALVSEGNRWDEYDTFSGARHAGLWWFIRTFADKHGVVPPAFGWRPSHLDLDEVAAGLA
eukprot:1435283-Pyramimonas_sp.AAC.1